MILGVGRLRNGHGIGDGEAAYMHGELFLEGTCVHCFVLCCGGDLF